MSCHSFVPLSLTNTRAWAAVVLLAVVLLAVVQLLLLLVLLGPGLLQLQIGEH